MLLGCMVCPTALSTGCALYPGKGADPAVRFRKHLRRSARLDESIAAPPDHIPLTLERTSARYEAPPADDGDGSYYKADAIGRYYKYDRYGNRMYAKPLKGTPKPP